MNSGRNVRKSTAEQSRASLEAKAKRKSVSENKLDNQSPSSQSIQKRQKLGTTEKDLKATSKVKAKPGRPPGPRRKPRQKVLTNSAKNYESSSITNCTVTDQRLPSRENENSPKVVSFDGLKGGTENQSNLESESMKKLSFLKYNNSFSKTPSPLVVDISGNTSPQIINSQELLEFLCAFEGKENKETESENEISIVKDESGLPGIERLEKSPSRFFECPLCYKMFTDGNLARSHLADTCPKLS